MAGAVPHAIHIRIREFHDKEEDACKDKEETASEKTDGGDSEDQHAQPETVQLSEAYQSRDDKRLQGTLLKIILSQSPNYHVTGQSKVHVMF